MKLKFAYSSMIAIDTIAVENEVADNMYQRSEPDYLIYNDPVGYADLILNGDPEAYLKPLPNTKAQIIDFGTVYSLAYGRLKIYYAPKCRKK